MDYPSTQRLGTLFFNSVIISLLLITNMNGCEFISDTLTEWREIYLIWKESQIPAVIFKEFQGADKRTILPDRVQSPVVAWRRSESRGHCGRLAAPAGGHANGRLPPGPDPSADAPAWWNRGSPRTPADCSSPTRAHGGARKGSATWNGGKGVKSHSHWYLHACLRRWECKNPISVLQLH